MSVAEQTRAERVKSLTRERYEMFVGGAWVPAASGATMDTIDPTTEETIATVPLAGADDVDRAVAAALEGQEEWKRLTWQQRAQHMRELAQAVADHAAELAELDAIDGGIPVTGMKKDVQNAVDFLLYFAGLASEIKGWTIETAQGVSYTRREPYGVVGRIIPFNHPIQFAASAVAAPLAAGNAVILKPAEQTPVSALRFAELASGILPAGVLNVVTGDGPTTGAALVSHPLVPRISFTGSVATGRAVLRAAAEEIKVVTLELGGKNPLVVFPDVDVRQVALATIDAMNFRRGQGQSCGSPSRIYAHEAIHDEFVETLKELVEELAVGDPLSADSDMGPLAFAAHYDRVTGYVASGRSEGARLVTGGGRPKDRDLGYFVEPTVFDKVEPSMAIAREEIFGPVISVLSWADEAEVLRAANALRVGLTAYVWTNDLSAAMRFSRELEAGYVWVNGRGQRPFGAPFGGHKQSGLGTENDLEELLSYTRVKNVSISPV
jgi:betaine-aldehyde dehydrogenase